jgi:hypothetical protein
MNYSSHFIICFMLKHGYRQTTGTVPSYTAKYYSPKGGFLRYLLGRRIYCLTSEGELEHSLLRYAQELRRGGKVAKVAAKIKLLEWIYHMMRDSKTFKDI